MGKDVTEVRSPQRKLIPDNAGLDCLASDGIGLSRSFIKRIILHLSSSPLARVALLPFVKVFLF